MPFAIVHGGNKWVDNVLCLHGEAAGPDTAGLTLIEFTHLAIGQLPKQALDLFQQDIDVTAQCFCILNGCEEWIHTPLVLACRSYSI